MREVYGFPEIYSWSKEGQRRCPHDEDVEFRMDLKRVMVVIRVVFQMLDDKGRGVEILRAWLMGEVCWLLVKVFWAKRKRPSQ